MWILGFIALIFIFIASDGAEKAKFLLIQIPLLIILIAVLCANPILGIILFLLIGFIAKNK